MPLIWRVALPAQQHDSQLAAAGILGGALPGAQLLRAKFQKFETVALTAMRTARRSNQ